MNKRKWLPNLSDLIDRLSIHQLKEVFMKENKNKYSVDMKKIINDIDIIIEERNIKCSADIIHAIVFLAQINTHIWYNESSVRKNKNQDLSLLKLTHGLNGLRNKTMNYILDLIGQKEGKDWKTDCLAAEFKDWEPSFLDVSKKGEEKNDKVIKSS